MYFNFDEIPDEKILAASLAAVGRIKEKGIPFTLAMQDDVNGIAWCLNDYFNQLGVKYLNIVIKGAWPDWWTDGFGASARETATTRLTSSSSIANEAGLSMASLSGVKLPDEINKSIALADNALL